MSASNDACSAGDSRYRAAPGRQPLLKMTRALVGAALSQGQSRTALRLIANALLAASRLPHEQQFELAAGVVAEAASEVSEFVSARVVGAGAC